MNFRSIYLTQRFFPTWLSIVVNPFYFSRKNLRSCLFHFCTKLNGRLLDFGCGSKPYKKIFENANEYIGVDVENEGHNHETEDIDFYYDGMTLPFKAAEFDSILCSEVLEHVPDIDLTLRELNRVLVPGGKILITVPFVWPEHELPYDFRRYTVNGLSLILEKYGFKIQEVVTSGSFFETITQMWMMYLHNGLYTKNRYLNILINAICIFPFCLLGLIFSFILPNVKGLYLNVSLLAEKEYYNKEV